MTKQFWLDMFVMVFLACVVVYSMAAKAQNSWQFGGNPYSPHSLSNPYSYGANPYSPTGVNNPYSPNSPQNPYSPGSPSNPYGYGLELSPGPAQQWDDWAKRFNK